MTYSQFVLHSCLFLAVISNQAGMEVARFEAVYRPAKTLRAAFLERYLENGNVVRAEAGIAYFRRPGKMRWEYESPDKNLFLVDGKSAWFYVPADHTVTKVPAKQSGDWRTPFAFLMGDVRIARICSQVSLAPQQPEASSGMVRLRCRFRNVSSFGKSAERAADSSKTRADNAELDLERETGLLRRVFVHDPGGVDIEFEFKNWQFDPPVPPQFFRFSPLPGVAIVNGELAADNGGINR
jgi:outer membrane lipoprotein carrier protein